MAMLCYCFFSWYSSTYFLYLALHLSCSLFYSVKSFGDAFHCYVVVYTEFLISNISIFFRLSVSLLNLSSVLLTFNPYSDVLILFADCFLYDASCFPLGGLDGILLVVSCFSLFIIFTGKLFKPSLDIFPV